ncbi:hypothetical protein ACP70R_019288 [Stipagrostis hirtigluma subsp. patula]
MQQATAGPFGFPSDGEQVAASPFGYPSDDERSVPRRAGGQFQLRAIDGRWRSLLLVVAVLRTRRSAQTAAAPAAGLHEAEGSRD